ncbi:hypothetical protein BDV93DRAFT_274241 [Ceratobasidium sp. AG-I]|nr:hypothetical protein BDV93DRAFT_274241 [Ceratobasidium sp. AG-I]
MAKSFLEQGLRTSRRVSVETSGPLAMLLPHTPIPDCLYLLLSLPVPMAFCPFFFLPVFLVVVNSVYFLSYSCILSVSIGIRDRLSGYYIFSRRCAGILYHRNCALPRLASPIYLTIDLFVLLPSPRPGHYASTPYRSGLATNKPVIT